MAKRSLLALAREYIVGQLTHHPGRYIEIVRILRKYQLYDVVTQLKMLQPREGAAAADGEQDLQAERLALALEELGTCFIKLGQVMSTRPDLLAAPYIAALARLQSTVTPVPGDEIAEIIESELGAPLSKLFRSLDYRPLAAASIAQVHRAVLHDGSQVVVKVQRPGVRRQVETDIEVMQEVARFATKYTSLGARYSLLPIVQEIKQSLSQELDFLQEADNTRQVGLGIEEFEHLITPTVYADYTTRRVLTLSFVPGRHLAEISCAELQRIDRKGIARELLSAYLKQIAVNGVFHCDPHPGNILLADNGRLALLDFGMVGRLDGGQIEKVILLLLAFSERQGERVANTYLEMMEVPEGFDRRAFTQEICALVTRYHDMSDKRMVIGRALLELTAVARAHRTSIPAEFMLIGKTLLNLDETLRVLAPEIDPIAVIRSYAEQALQQQVLAQMSPARFYTWFLDARHLVDNMLRRTDIIIDKLAHDQLSARLKIDSLDDTIQRAARRLSFGMIVSSLILSMALLFRSKKKFD